MARRPPDPSGAPPLSRWLREPFVLPKIAAAPLRRPPDVQKVGGGRPVLVIPGMLSGDRSTALLRKTFDAAGFRSFPAGLGINATLRVERLAALEARLARIVEECGSPAVIVGWSLGGLYARVLAQRHPELVRLVATLGTPFSGDRHANNAWRLYELLADHRVDAPPIPDDPATKPAAYTMAFWSGSDGVIAEHSARGLDGERDEAIELPSRHFEMGVSKRAVKRVVDTISARLAVD